MNLNSKPDRPCAVKNFAMNRYSLILAALELESVCEGGPSDIEYRNDEPACTLGRNSVALFANTLRAIAG